MEKSEAVIKAIRDGADVNATDEEGNNILHKASETYQGVSVIATALLNKGFDFTAKNKEGLTPFDITAKQDMYYKTYVGVNTLSCYMIKENSVDALPILFKALKTNTDTEFRKTIIRNLAIFQANVAPLLNSLSEDESLFRLFCDHAPIGIIVRDKFDQDYQYRYYEWRYGPIFYGRANCWF